MNKIIRIIMVTALMISMLGGSALAETETGKNKSVKFKETSFNIEIKNIDTKTIYDTRKLSGKDIDAMKSIGISDEIINNSDKGKLKELVTKEKLTDKDIENLIYIYPELENNKNIKNWTQEDCNNYIDVQNDILFAPDKSTSEELKKFGLTINDARHLLTYYDSYAEIMKQPKDTLKEILTEYYTFKLDYLNFMNSNDETYSNSTASFFNLNLTAEAAVTPPYSQYLYLYDIVSSFPGYVEVNDYFHIDTDTVTFGTRLDQASRAKELYQIIYSTSASPVFTNLWGTHSGSQRGAHEGVDMVKGLDSSIKNPLTRSYLVDFDGYAELALRCGSTNKVTFFYHMSVIKTNGIAYQNTPLGTENTVGNSTGSHLHFEVEDGFSSSAESAVNDHDLDSLNPYYYMNY